MGFLFEEDEKTEEIKCKTCGKQNAAKFNFCTKCGHEQNKPRSLGQLIKAILLAPVHLLFGKYEPPPPNKYCDACPDKLFVPEANFCGYCGKKLAPIRVKPIDPPQVFKTLIGGAIGFGIGFLAAPFLLSAPSAEAATGVKAVLGFVGILSGMVIAPELKLFFQVVRRVFTMFITAMAIYAVFVFVNAGK